MNSTTNTVSSAQLHGAKKKDKINELNILNSIHNPNLEKKIISFNPNKGNEENIEKYLYLFFFRIN